MLTVDLNRGLGKSLNRCAHAYKNVKQDLDVAYRRYIVDYAGLLVENARANNGKGCVFHAVYCYVTVKGTSAVNNDVFHVLPPSDPLKKKCAVCIYRDLKKYIFICCRSVFFAVVRSRFLMFFLICGTMILYHK